AGDDVNSMSIVPPPIFSCAASCALADTARTNGTHTKKNCRCIDLISETSQGLRPIEVHTGRGGFIPAVERKHHYSVAIVWTGNIGQGTQSYSGYERAHEIRSSQKPVVPGSSDPAFRGDPTRYNPEELFVAALSSCHMLWYLHLCADAGIVVVSYQDNAEGTM